MGVEEEYLVVDPATREVVPRAGEVAQASGLGDQAGLEITRYQVEARTTPHDTVAGLEAEIREMRAAMAAGARSLGLAVIASGTAVLGNVVPPLITEDPRYAIGIATYGSLHDEQAICAGHVHVHVPDRREAVLAGNHVRPWLPVLLALTANSPMWAGADTGYASRRIQCWAKWPVAGPPPYFAGEAEYDDLARTLTAAGVLVDPGTIFYDVRPSARLPTVETRVADVPATAAESALLAAITRALVTTAVERIRDGDPGPRISAELLRASYWRAARDGLEGAAIDPATGDPLPCAQLLERLIKNVTPALAATGDLDLVTTRVAALAETGSGAARQRAVLTAGGRPADVVDLLVERFLA